MGAEAAAALQRNDIEGGAMLYVARRKQVPTLLPEVGFALVLFAVSAAGAVVLVWWVVRFHQENRQLWMVPVGLVLVGTPIISCFSIFASDFDKILEGSRDTTAIVTTDASEVAMEPCVAIGGDDVKRER